MVMGIPIEDNFDGDKFHDYNQILFEYTVLFGNSVVNAP